MIYKLWMTLLIMMTAGLLTVSVYLILLIQLLKY